MPPLSFLLSLSPLPPSPSPLPEGRERGVQKRMNYSRVIFEIVFNRSKRRLKKNEVYCNY
jgi:hypothetical protein